MSATAPAVATTASGPKVPSRHPQAARVMTTLLVGGLGGFLLLNASAVHTTLGQDWTELLFWIALTAVVNMFPVPATGGQLALDMPILMGVGFLYAPSVAAATAFVAALDVRELKGEVSVGRALFNRSQVALSVVVASVIFREVGGDVHQWPHAVLAVSAALTASYLTNVVLVSTYTSLRQGTSWGRSLRGLSVGRSGRFLATYLSCGALSLVVARLFVDIGPSPVILLMAPILIARQTLVRERELETLANTLRDRERILERLSQRIVDERRDERLRLAADLHDDLLQTLTHTWMFSTLVAKETHRTGETSPDLQQVIAGSKASLDTLRQTIRSLQASAVGREGLVPTLDALVRDLRLASGLKIRLAVPSDAAIPPDLQLLVYQLARESLLNAVRHSGAGTIDVCLSLDGDFVMIEVKDDGHGFDPADFDASEHFGLGLMRERARMAGGKIQLWSSKGRGTTVQVSLPIGQHVSGHKG